MNIYGYNTLATIQLNKNNNTIQHSNITNFQSDIPHKQIKKLSAKYLKLANNDHNETSFFQMAEEYFKKHLLSLIAGTAEDKNDTGDLLHLFRHELINNITAKFELNINPLFKDTLPEIDNGNKKFSYLIHQQKKFKEIIITIKDMVLMWKKIENWKKHPTKPVHFSEIEKTLKKAAKFGNIYNADIQFHSKINSKNLITKNAFEQYNILSQIILNALKYSEGKPVKVEFSKTPEHQALGKNIYTMTVTNNGTKPISNEDIDKILDGTGHRTNDRNINGTGTGYTEIVAILKKYYSKDAKTMNLIEKNRKSGVKVTVPYKLSEYKSSFNKLKPHHS